MMESAIVKEINAIQADMVTMEGMLAVLAAGAFHGIRAEYIGNSLKILSEYLGQRSDRLDMLLNTPEGEMEGGGTSGE